MRPLAPPATGAPRYMAFCAAGTRSGHDRGPYMPDIRFLWPTIMKPHLPATRNARDDRIETGPGTGHPAARAAGPHITPEARSKEPHPCHNEVVGRHFWLERTRRRPTAVVTELANGITWRATAGTQ